ncbi:MAG: glycosyltransferase, partial [Cyclobacteriaceae bacterium]
AQNLEVMMDLYPSESFEVFVVNDSDKPLEIDISDKRIHFLKNEGKGAASARNFGVKRATKRNLLFLDDDIMITSGHLKKHLESLNRFPGSLITANRTESDDLKDLLMKTPFGRYKFDHDYIWHQGFSKEEIDERYMFIEGAATFSCSMEKSTFNSLGGFDESFPYAGSEDYDLFERAIKSGHKLIFDQHNMCFHNEPYNADMNTWMQRHYKGVASFILLCNKHTEIRNIDRYRLYQRLSRHDDFKTGLFKLKATILSTFIGRIILNTLIKTGEMIGLHSQTMKRIYNAKFVSVVKQGFIDFKQLDKK